MANTKISDFTSGAPAQSTDEFVIARTGANFKLAASDIKTLVVGAGSVSVASGKTLTANNTLTLAGTDSTTMTFPSTSATLARTDAGNTFTGNQTVNGGTITADAPVLNLSQTWNASGVTFTGLRFNVTDTASAAGSLLMDLQLGGVSRISASKTSTGNAFTINAPTAQTSEMQLSVNSTTRWRFGYDPAQLKMFFRNQAGGFTSVNLFDSAPTNAFNLNDTGLFLAGNLFIGWSDLFLTRRAAANLRLGAADAAAPVAQTLSVQSVVAGTSNTAGANLTITGSQGTGTGAGGAIIFQVAPAGSSGTAQNALATALTILPSGAVQFNSTTGATPSLFFSGNDFFISQDANNPTTTQYMSCGSDGVKVNYTRGGGNRPFGLSNGGTFDVQMHRDAANTLALRNGTNAQTFNIYNTFTSSTNFERFRIVAQSAAAVLIGTEKGSGGGTARALELQTDATSRLTLDTVGSARIVTALTVATLPAAPLTGMIARVTDALGPAVGVTVAAGGAAQALCWYNGANWTVIGV